MFQNLSAHAFAIKSVGWVRKIRVLPIPEKEILPSQPRHDNLRMFFIEPGRNGGCRRAHDDADARRVELFYSTIHPCEFKLAIFRLPQPPAEFPDTDDGYTGLLHELHILLEPVVGHILRVIRYAVQHGIHAISPERFAGLGFPR